MTIDVARINALLSAIKGITEVAPGYTHIISEAMAELRMINEDTRRSKQEENGKTTSPAPVGDTDSPPPVTSPEASDSGQVVDKPVASSPVKKDIKLP